MLRSEIDLTKLKVEQAENMSMSIRPSSSGLTFIVYEGKDFDGAEQEGFLSLDTSPKAWSERVSDLFFTHSFLALPFHRVKLYYEAVQGLIIPNELYQEHFDELWQTYVNHDEELTTLREELANEGKSLLFYLPKALLTFLQRTHIRLEVAPYILPSLAESQLKTRQKASRSLSLSLRYGALDCWLLEKGALQFYNTYPIVEQQNAQAIEGELMYYLFMLVSELGLDLEEDELTIVSSKSESETIKSLLAEATERLDQNLVERIHNYKKEED